MSSINIIYLFEKYMENKNIPRDTIDYNIKVVELLNTNILFQLNKELDSIDIYSFEEFTDLIDIIDKELLGREGIEKILDAMLTLTEFLKTNKLIKGGKIAYYRKIFSNKDYYLDKYDSVKGKKDNAKNFIKKITKNSLSYRFTRILEHVDVDSFSTVIDVKDVLDEECSREFSPLLINALKNINLIEEKRKTYLASKRGRAILRLEPEERYSGILYALLYEVNWQEISDNVFNINELIAIICSIFIKNDYISIKKKESLSIEDPLSFTNDNLRFELLLKNNFNKDIFEMIFINMGIIEKNIIEKREVYSITHIGKSIIHLLYSENKIFLKSKLDKISFLIKNKSLGILENEIINFIKVFGSSTAMWDYLGQIYILRKSYEEAYKILSYAYETSTKRGNIAKRTLLHLIVCCRNLQFSKEEEKYEKKYKLIQR